MPCSLRGGSLCLALLGSRIEGFLVSPATPVPSNFASAGVSRATSAPKSTISPFAAETFFPQEESMVQQPCDQDFQGFFPPVHRPLSLLDISEAERGLWVFEQVIFGDDVCHIASQAVR